MEDCVGNGNSGVWEIHKVRSIGSFGELEMTVKRGLGGTQRFGLLIEGQEREVGCG